MADSTTEHQPSVIPTATELGFDPAAIRNKYAEERAKRLRPDGNDQYLEVTGRFKHYNEVDPYIEPGFTRPAIVEELDVVIVGGGFGGLMAAARLLQAGITNVRIIEKAGDFGGTWYWNRYPGAQCDIESYVYLPLLEETGYIPTMKYAFAPEIFEHAQRIGKHFDLYAGACLQTQVEEGRWDVEAGRWTIKTDRDDVLKPRFLVIAPGPLNRPKLPGIPGIETFKGHAFHTSRWDFDYTGGNSMGGLDKLHNKRVGIIGTGASAIQCVEHLGADAQQLYVFQRTPSSVDERGNKPTDPDWARDLKPGWQLARSLNFNAVVTGVPVEEDLVGDGWTSIFQHFKKFTERAANGSELTREELAQLSEIAEHQKMEEVRGRVAKTVHDPQTAGALQAWYGQLCKRPTFNDTYLPTFNRANVQLVDTNGKGVERITENAVIVDGVEYEVDCLVLGTGFEVGTSYARQAQLELYGQDGVTLSKAWANGRRTFQGFLSHGFPNCFQIGITQTGASPSFTYMYAAQSDHITYIINEVLARGARSVEPTAEAEAAYLQLVMRSTPMTEYQKTCTPGFYNAEGQLSGGGFHDSSFPGGAVRFQEMLTKWRESGELEGLMLS
jgi:cyclohexanone monooxygenase|tara:strand:+ start:5561 stop:7396 length:1836 start_codon:yes stop_codon:yes gene_type:complete